MGMVGETCLPSKAYFHWTPDYTLSFRVHDCSSDSNVPFVYRFMSLLYGLGTLTTTYFLFDIALFLLLLAPWLEADSARENGNGGVMAEHINTHTNEPPHDKTNK